MSDTVPGEPDRDTPETEDVAEISLQVDEMTKIFDEGGDRVMAVENVSIDIREGEFLVLVGPSGCGKTTTLRTIAGLESPTEGRIIINGDDVSGQEPRERDIAMVFQNYALYPHKTVRENLSFPLEVRKYPKSEIQEKVEDTATLLGIAELLDRHPSDLSGWQQQRVALGRAIVRDPEVFLFDEPLSNLDAKLRIQMRTELNKLHERVGKTSVYVTHDQAEAMTLGDRVAVMNDGRIQQIAPPQEVYDRPANRFVAGFIGEPPMNFFDASVEERDGELFVVTEAFELTLHGEKAEKIRAYQGSLDDLELGIRPEDMYDAAVTLEENVSTEDSFDAEVRVVEPMGAHIDLALHPEGMSGDEFEFTGRVAPDSEAREGDVLTLAVDMEKIHLFDRKTGENLTR